VEGTREVTVLLIEEGLERARIAEQPLMRELEGGRAAVVRHGSLEEATGTLLEGGFDCILLGLTLLDGAALGALRGVRARAPQAPIVVLSTEDDQSIALRAEDEGADAFLAKGQAAGDRLWREIDRAIEQKHAALAAARRATHDELTGLPNRALFLDRLGLTLGRLQRRSRAAAVLFLGLNDFRSVNDRFGHEIGDRLLVAVGERLSELLRPGDTVGRFGSDEFMLLCDDISSEEDATAVADRLGAELRLPFELEQLDVTVAASFGVVVAEGTGRAAEELLHAAHRGMKAAKGRGARWQLAHPAEPAGSTAG